MNDRPRLGFLGVGWIGRHRMEMIQKDGIAEIAGICDPSPEMIAEAKKTAPKAKVYASYDPMLDADLDGIVIATPSALHADQSIRALKRGKAVFCQKPLGRNLAETNRVIQAACEADRLLGVDLSYRHTEGMQRIRNLLLENAIGDIYGVELVFHNAYGPDKAWFYIPELSGGGCVMDLGVHLVDLTLWALDFPAVEKISSRLWKNGRPVQDPQKEVEDYAVSTMELANGAAARLSCSWKLNAGQDAVIEASFYGTRGGLTFRNVNGSFYDFTAERLNGTRRESLAKPPDSWGGRAGVIWAKHLAANPGFEAKEASHLATVAEALDRIYGRN